MRRLNKKSLAIEALTAGVRARREREERERQERLRQAECARMAGRRVTGGRFGDSEVEIYENGYVRVAGSSEDGCSCRIDELTPYENLISISFERPDNGSSGVTGVPSVATAGTAVKVVSMIAKRHPLGMAVSGGIGLAAAGAGTVTKIMSAKAVLTITTDQRVHVLTNQVKHSSTRIPMPRKDHESVGAVLEQTGNSVLTALGRGLWCRTFLLSPPDRWNRLRRRVLRVCLLKTSRNVYVSWMSCVGKAFWMMPTLL